MISSLKLTPSKFVAAKRGPSIAAAKKPPKQAAAAKKRAAAAKGAGKLRFTGRLAGRTLGADRYRLRLVATDAAKNHSAAATAASTVKRH